MIDPRPRDRRLAWVALGFTALALVFTWPLALGLSRDVPGDLGDSLLNMWILAWGAEHAPRLLTGTITWAAFWNGNIFHPEPYSLAFSEHMFAQALQIAPIYALTGNIILGYNLLFLSTFVISAIGAYLLARDLTGDWRAGIIAGLVFGFLPYRISQVPHLQVMSSQWMPLALWGFHRYIAFRSTRGLIGGTIALVLQNWSCGYYLLYFAPFVPLFVVQQLWSAGRLGDRRAWASLAAAALATIGLTLPFLLPYLEVQRLYAFERPFGEVLAFSANVWSYATAAEPIHLWGRLLRYHPHGEGETFLGVTAPILALVAMAVAVADGRAAAATVPPLSAWRRRLTQLLIVLFVVQAVAWLSTVLVGGFSVRVAGLSIRASTPVRLLMQTLIPFFLLALVSPRWRTGVSRTAAQPITAIVALLVIAVWLSLGPAPSAGPYRVSGFGLYDALVPLRARIHRRPRAGALRDDCRAVSGTRRRLWRVENPASILGTAHRGRGCRAHRRRRGGDAADDEPHLGNQRGHAPGPRVPSRLGASHLCRCARPAGGRRGGGVSFRRSGLGDPRGLLRRRHTESGS